MKKNKNFNYSDDEISEKKFIGHICTCCGKKINMHDTVKKYECICGYENTINQIHKIFNTPDFGPTKSKIEGEEKGRDFEDDNRFQFGLFPTY